MPPTAHAADRDADRPDRGLHVLIADDDAAGAEALARLLERAGHAVRVVFDGASAVAAALADPPDVLLVDIGLPGLDGWEVARRVRAGLGRRPCGLVAVTGHDGPGDRDRSRRAGIDLHLPKPVDPGALGVALDRVAGPTGRRGRAASV